MPEGPEFQARIERRGDIVVVIVEGELDMDSVGRLRTLLAQPDSSAPTVVLDLRGLSFMDSSGLSLIVGEYRRAQTDGSRFAVAIAGAKQVERLFDLTGLRGTIEVVDDPSAVPAT
jgi:anti-sigma B factor antagonist